VVRLRRLGPQPTTLAPCNRHRLTATERWFESGGISAAGNLAGGGASMLYSSSRPEMYLFA
jgi:hypothetical protein